MSTNPESRPEVTTRREFISRFAVYFGLGLASQSFLLASTMEARSKNNGNGGGNSGGGNNGNGGGNGGGGNNGNGGGGNNGNGNGGGNNGNGGGNGGGNKGNGNGNNGNGKGNGGSNRNGQKPGNGNKTVNLSSKEVCSGSGSSGGGATMQQSEYQQAQSAVRNGRAMPLGKVMERVNKRIGGKLIEVRFSDSGGGTQYAMRMVSDRGNLVAVQVNALNAQILSVNGC